MTITTRKRSTEIPWTEPLDTPDLRAEATAAAEEQLTADRQRAKQVLSALHDAITNRSKSAISYRLAEITWLEHRLTQTETQHVALWCRECAVKGDAPAELPGRYWMAWECWGHAEAQLNRSAKSWERSLFA